MMPTVMTTGSTAATTTMMTAAAEAATPHEAARSRARGCVCPALPISGSRSTASIAPSPATVRHLLARARALLQQYSVQYSNQRMHAHGVHPPPPRCGGLPRGRSRMDRGGGAGPHVQRMEGGFAPDTSVQAYSAVRSSMYM